MRWQFTTTQKTNSFFSPFTSLIHQFTQQTVRCPSLDIEVATLAPRYPSSPHHLFPRAHSGSSASIKSERASPLHFDSSLHTALTFRPAPSSTTPSSSTDTFRFSNAPHLSLPLLLDVDQHQSSPSSRISMASSPHSAHIPDGWSLKRSNAPPSVHAPVLPLDLGDMSHTDEYDDELVDFPFTGSLASQGSHNEKIIRRRSSKACDQCRKSKCKCERTPTGDACKNCAMLRTPCTFLGPSRKRGPPKGYIDAIEARLHQTEALLGILLALEADPSPAIRIGDDSEHLRQESLHNILAALRQDTLAREILNHVDMSPYGVRGRKSGKTKLRPTVPLGLVDLQTTHPSREWQDRLISRLVAVPSVSRSSCAEPARASDDEQPSKRPRQRRRLELDSNFSPSAPSSSPSGRHSASAGSSPALSRVSACPCASARGCGVAEQVDGANSEVEEDVFDAIGQLSLNEDRQIRYHGKASGLYLLSAKAEARNEGGIWRFPKARVWPSLPPTSSQSPNLSSPPRDAISISQTSTCPSSDGAQYRLPDPAMQDHLLELYFTYVQSVFPILHKGAFWDAYRNAREGDADIQPQVGGSLLPIGGHDVSPLLLLSMFATAARYSASSEPLSTSSTSPMAMWTAGDEYLVQAKTLLDKTYTAPRASTVQALLLLGYRELGIGSMAQAWMYTGMAVRMAQDLGMHRAADAWARVGLEKLFGAQELQSRRCIWWGCVVLDVYVSAYIGRPLAITDRDYDTQLPTPDELDEREAWVDHGSLPPDVHGHGYHPGVDHADPVTGHTISCFVASSTLSTILARIIQTSYAVRLTESSTRARRREEAAELENALDRWHLDLPAHLRVEIRYESTTPTGDNGRVVVCSSDESKAPGSSGVPPPHVLALHMQYWCTVLLLHRPFMRTRRGNGMVECTRGGRRASERHYEQCVAAANCIASIASYFREKYCLQRAPMFLCFYVFTAAIMHVTSLSTCPEDPQAQLGLKRSMDVLQDMEVVWPSAARALELLRGCAGTYNTLGVSTTMGTHTNNAFSSSNVGGESSITTARVQHQPRATPAPPSSQKKRTAAQLSGAALGTTITSTTTRNSIAATAGYDCGPTGHLATLSQAPPATFTDAWRAAGYGAPSDGHGVSTGSGTLATTSSTDTGGRPDVYASTPGTGVGASFFPWTEESDVAYPGSTLSTSVLPQTYSTELVDQRVGHLDLAHHDHAHGHAHEHRHGQSHEQPTHRATGHGHADGGARYPQYWSDYTSFGQIGPVYGGGPERHEGGHVSGAAAEGMYLGGHGQYGGMFDSHPPSSV